MNKDLKGAIHGSLLGIAAGLLLLYFVLYVL